MSNSNKSLISDLEDDSYYDFNILSETTDFVNQSIGRTKKAAWIQGQQYETHTQSKMIGGIMKLSETPYAEENIVFLLDGGVHDDLDPRTARCNVISFQLNGKKISFLKEIEHSHEIGFVLQKERIVKDNSIPDVRGKYVGILVVEQTGRVKIPNVSSNTEPVIRDAKRFIVYIDTNPLDEEGRPKNNWEKVFVVYDYGQLDTPPIFEPYILSNSVEYMYVDRQSDNFKLEQTVFRSIDGFGEVDIQTAEKEMKLIFTDEPEPRNIPPLVIVPAIIEVTQKGQLVEIDASQSVDPDGDSSLLQFNIELIGGINTPQITKVNPNGSKIRFNFPSDRQQRSQIVPAYLFRVTVTDEKGDFRSVKVRIMDMIDYGTTPPQDPVAKLTASQTQITVGQTVTLDASGSTNYDSLQVSQTLGQQVNLQNVGNNKWTFVAPQSQNSYQLGFQAKATKGTKTSTANVTISVTVTPQPQPVKAVLLAPSSIQSGQTVILDASQSIADTVTITQTGGQNVVLIDVGTWKKQFVAPQGNFQLAFQAVAQKGGSQSIVQVAIQVVTNQPGGNLDKYGIKWLIADGDQFLVEQSRDQATDDRWSGNITGLRNGFEATMIAMSIGTAGGGEAHFAMKQFSGNHSGSGTEKNAWYDTGVRDTGEVQLQYEQPHPRNHDFTLPDSQWFIKHIGVGLEGRWIGLKWSCLCLKPNGSPENGGVRCRMWVDTDPLDTEGKPKNNWQLVYDFVDTGQVIKGHTPPDEQDCEVRRSDTREHKIYAGGLHVRRLGTAMPREGVATITRASLNKLIPKGDLHIKDAPQNCVDCKPQKPILVSV